MSREPDTIAAALAAAGLERVDARILLQHVLGMSHARLLAHPERKLSPSERLRFGELANRRRAGEPIAYLVGQREFYGRMFTVTPAVLIPRPETELLVELALERIPPAKLYRVLDLGTGSGNVAITVALERAHARVHAVDTSERALQVARANARSLGANNVTWIEGEWFEPPEVLTYDVIMSNPPYVSASDPHLEQGDLRYEPSSALAAGPDGLQALRHIIGQAVRHLAPGGWLLLEHGYDQADSVATLLRAHGYVEPLVAHDLAGLPRVSGARTP